jgi:hypothetical protein
MAVNLWITHVFSLAADQGSFLMNSTNFAYIRSNLQLSALRWRRDLQQRPRDKH